MSCRRPFDCTRACHCIIARSLEDTRRLTREPPHLPNTVKTQDAYADARPGDADDMDTDAQEGIAALKYDNLDQVSKLTQTERYKKILQVRLH